MKTEKYYIRFEAYEICMCRDIAISKTEYLTQLKFMENQLQATADYEIPVESRHVKEYRHEAKHYTEYVTTFRCGCTYTDLVRLVCDEGYEFTPKSRRKV